MARKTDTFIPGGITIHPSGETLYVAGTWGHGICILPVADPEARTTIPLETDSYPYTCLLDLEAKRLFVSLWNKSAIAVIDLAKKEVVATWETEKHPTEMVLSHDGKTLFVACANSTRVSVVDTATGKAAPTLACSLFPSAPAGNTPMSLALTPDSQLLFVANADCNNLAVFNVADLEKPSRSASFPSVGIPPACLQSTG